MSGFTQYAADQVLEAGSRDQHHGTGIEVSGAAHRQPRRDRRGERSELHQLCAHRDHVRAVLGDHDIG